MEPQEAKARLTYCPETGHFHWKPIPGEDSWNKRYAGKQAGGVKVNSNGAAYRYIKISGKQHSEHRLAWMMMTGEPAPAMIDHRNRSGLDNRWVNLRDGSAMNCRNRSKQDNNRSGLTGACFHKRSGKWEAYVRNNGTKQHLGLFSTPNQAGEVALERRREIGFDATHGA